MAENVSEMYVGVLQFDLLIRDSRSLKDKRRVVRSIKDRLHRRQLVGVAEVGDPDILNLARIAITCAGRDGTGVGNRLDRISAALRLMVLDAELGRVRRLVMPLSGWEVHNRADEPDPALERELTRRGIDALADLRESDP